MARFSNWIFTIGHACMATHKYIHENNLQNEFDVIASAPCSGPYDLSNIMADTIMSHTVFKSRLYYLLIGLI